MPTVMTLAGVEMPSQSSAWLQLSCSSVITNAACMQVWDYHFVNAPSALTWVNSPASIPWCGPYPLAPLRGRLLLCMHASGLCMLPPAEDR
jgi:hypothetical protein